VSGQHPDVSERPAGESGPSDTPDTAETPDEAAGPHGRPDTDQRGTDERATDEAAGLDERPAADEAAGLDERPAAEGRGAADGRGAPDAAGVPGGAESVGAAPRRIWARVPAVRRILRWVAKYAVAVAFCLAVAGILLIVLPGRHHGTTPTVHYGADLAELRRTAPFAAYAPESLSPAWRPISTRLSGTGGRGEPVSWHLGFLTPSGQYAALEESDERAEGPGGFVIRMVSEGRPDGVEPVNGHEWQRYHREDKNQRSLVRRLPGLTLVVTGNADYGELATLAAALRPA
jgi:hypothetical protein